MKSLFKPILAILTMFIVVACNQETTEPSAETKTDEKVETKVSAKKPSLTYYFLEG